MEEKKPGVGILEEMQEEIGSLKRDVLELYKLIGTMKRDHNFDMKFINSQIDHIANKANIDLSECDFPIENEI